MLALLRRLLFYRDFDLSDQRRAIAKVMQSGHQPKLRVRYGKETA